MDSNYLTHDDESDPDFDDWLKGDPDQESDCVDSDVDSEEAMDGVGELHTFAQPPSFDSSISIIFMIDTSGAMRKCDVNGVQCSRAQAVLAAVRDFIVQQRQAGAVRDKYTVATFSDCVKVAFEDKVSEEALTALETTSVLHFGPANSMVVFEALSSLPKAGQHTRVIILSAGRSCVAANNGELVLLQRVVARNPLLDVHTIGFGSQSFLFLQQVSQIGRGSFSNASADMATLMNTFTSLSATITQTRERDRVQERPARQASFEHARVAVESMQNPRLFPQKRHSAVRRTHHLKRRDLLRISEEKPTSYLIRKRPFMLGGMRLVHPFCDLEMEWLPMVAKFSKYEEDDLSWDYTSTFLRNTAKARVFGNRFHYAVRAAYDPCGSFKEPRRLIKIAQCWSYQQRDKWFVAEPFLQGSESGFIKWVNNRGEILVPSNSSHYAMAVETFVHFTLAHSQGQFMVSDIQGVPCKGHSWLSGVHLTDPQIISNDCSFGAADLGPAAMQKFKCVHVCNSLCRRLKLPALNIISKVPRTRPAVAGPRGKSPIRQTRAQILPSTACESFQPPARGRSPVRRQKMGACSESSEQSSALKHETITADRFVMADNGQALKLLFVGEYTHLFSTAAAKLVASKWPSSESSLRLEWLSTELRWPTDGKMVQELKRCQDTLRKYGVQVLDGVDATNLKLQAQGLQGAIWVMAFPHKTAERSSSLSMRERMQHLVEGFVKSVAAHLEDTGTVSIVFLAMQHVAWKLPTEVDTNKGRFIREVFWLELEPFHTLGYEPRYGDQRDRTRSAHYHLNDTVVVARWRPKRGSGDRPGGMTDQRVRSESAGRRNASASRRSGSRSVSPWSRSASRRR